MLHNYTGNIPQDIRQDVRNFLNHNWDLISEDIHAASYLLDPTTCGKVVEDTILTDAERLIKLINGSKPSASILAEFTKFRAQQGIYQQQEITDPVLYWQRLSMMKSSQDLAKIALELLAFPQSMAAAERTFSAVRRIHTWQRNRLGRKKLAKLVYIYINQRALNKMPLKQ